MKRKTAKELLVESFKELAEKKNVEKITIKDITDNCGYSPATFYRNFRDKYDLIAWDYVMNTNEIMGKIGKEQYEWRHTLFDAAEYYWENREYLKNLFLHTSGHESFVRYVAKTNIGLLKNEICRRMGKKELDKETEILVHIYCFGFVESVCEWIMGGIDVTPEMMGKMFEASLPEPLKKYLY